MKIKAKKRAWKLESAHGPTEMGAAIDSASHYKKLGWDVRITAKQESIEVWVSR